VSEFGDYQDEMITHLTLNDRTIEALVAGRAPDDLGDLAALASLLAEIRSIGDTAPPEPTAALASVLAYGLPNDMPVMARTNVAAPARRASRQSRGQRAGIRVGGLPSAIAGKLAALGLAAKVGLTLLTATAAAAAGAAATGLSEPASHAVDTAEDPTSAASRPENAEFGASVSADASDEDDPGVVGQEVAEEARARAADAPQASPQDNPATDAASDGLTRAREETADTPAQVPTEVGPGAANGRRPEDLRAGPPEGTTPAGPPEFVTPGSPDGIPSGRPTDSP
jgi:hypothetical protein